MPSSGQHLHNYSHSSEPTCFRYHEKDCVRKGTPETEGTTHLWRHNNVLPLEAFRLYFRLVGISSVPTIPPSWYRRISLEEQSVGTAGPVNVQSARCEFHLHLGMSRSGLLCALIFIEAVIWYLRKASRAQQISATSYGWRCVPARGSAARSSHDEASSAHHQARARPFR
jgi:hypothetical protein